MKIAITAVTAFVTIMVTTTAQAFCGFYVAKADTSLFNRASQVVLVRDDDRTVITMANDFEGKVEDFAVVIPVPTKIEREQINVGDRAVIQHLDAYTSPRLVEYHDGNPCMRYELEERASSDAALPAAAKQLKRSARSRGVTIEASYTVGEYDILILSAKESNGLIRWLNDNGYKIPRGAKRVVDSYLGQDMRFFVAKVNVEEQSKLGYQYLRPLQVAYESNKFMLPIRLGTLNAKGKQELYVYALTRTGRVPHMPWHIPRVIDHSIPLPSLETVEPIVTIALDCLEVGEQRAVFFTRQARQGNPCCGNCCADGAILDELMTTVFYFLFSAPDQDGSLAHQYKHLY